MTSFPAARRRRAAPAPAAAAPQYQRVYELLRRRIQDGEYVVGRYLPPEPDIGNRLHVSRTTVRKAVEMLVRDGYVRVRRGVGTEVLDFRTVQKLQVVTSFSETLREQGFAVAYRGVHVERVPSSASLAEELGVPRGAPLVRVDRVALADGKPIALMQNHLVPKLVPDIATKAARIGSLYAFLEAEYNLVIDAATDFISARAASGPEARALEIRAGAPVLVVKRITWSGSAPIERADLVIVARMYEYSVRTTHRPGRAGS